MAILRLMRGARGGECSCAADYNTTRGARRWPPILSRRLNGGIVGRTISCAAAASAPLDSEGGFMATKRTTHRSVSGTKLYAVRDSKGRFKDIQTYKRAHAQDIKRGSRAEKKRK
jgi:hypothetical protein